MPVTPYMKMQLQLRHSASFRQFAFHRLWKPKAVIILGLFCFSPLFAQPAGPLSCALTLNPDPVVPGRYLTAQFTVGNSSASSVAAVVLRLSVPSGMTLFSGSSFPTPNGGGGYSGGDLCTWTLGTLAPGESRSIIALFSVSSSLRAGTNVAFRPVVTATGVSDIQLSESVAIVEALPLRALIEQDKDPVRTGDALTYTVTVANVESVNAPNASLAITLPAGVTFVGASHDGAFSGGIVRWALGTLSPSESIERSVTVTVGSGLPAGSLLTARASVSDTTVPQNSARTSIVAALATNVPLVARIAVNPNPTIAGATLRAVITVGNQSASDYGSVTVRLCVPDSLTLFSGRSYPDTAGGGGYSVGDIPAWNLGTLRAGQTRTILVPFSVTSGLSPGALRQLYARVDAANGIRAQSVQVAVVDSSPVLTLAVDEDRDPVAAGESLTYSVAIGNPTNVDSPNVTLRAAIPTGTSFVSATGGATESGGIVTWNLGTVGRGRSGTRSFTVRLNNDVPSGSLLTARVTAEDTLDPQNTARTITHTSVRPGVPLAFGFSFASNLYTMSLSNRGSADLGGVTVYGFTPDYHTIFSGTTIPAPDGGGGYSAGDLARWTLGSVFAGQTRTITVPLNLSSNAVNGTLMTYQGVATQSSNDLVLVKKLTLRIGTPTQITLQPRSSSVSLGGTVTFSVTTDGTDLPIYQWSFNGQPISGATGPALTLTNVQVAQAGSYTLSITNSSGTLISEAAQLTVNANDARLVNLSIRSQAGTGAQTLIVGFNLSAGATKTLLIRGIGPTLTGFGVGGALPDPQLQLFSGSTVLAQNDNWGGGAAITSAAANVGAFALAPASRDAALLQSLGAGGYSAQIGGGTGVALVEVYDAGSSGGARLTNLSARTQVGTGGDILIAGFVIGGTTSKTLLVRAIGPTLGTFGVTGALVDPRLDLYTGSTLVQSNDNWGGASALTSAFGSVGAFALSPTSRDSALLVTLQPGSYTAQVSGVGNTTGVALVEVYELP